MNTTRTISERTDALLLSARQAGQPRPEASQLDRDQPGHEHPSLQVDFRTVTSAWRDRASLAESLGLRTWEVVGPLVNGVRPSGKVVEGPVTESPAAHVAVVVPAGVHLSRERGLAGILRAVVAAPQATTHKLASRPAIFLMTAPPLLTFGEACKAPVAVRFQFSCRWGNRFSRRR